MALGRLLGTRRNPHAVPVGTGRGAVTLYGRLLCSEGCTVLAFFCVVLSGPPGVCVLGVSTRHFRLTARGTLAMPVFVRSSGLKSLLAKKNSSRLQVELLEDRIALSWGSTPPASITPPASYTSVTLDPNGDATGAASITANEIDWYKFTASAGGTYVFDGTTPSSSLDTVIATYTAAGSRVGYNDDYNGTTDSHFSVTLTAGQAYFFGVTNYTGT